MYCTSGFSNPRSFILKCSVPIKPRELDMKHVLTGVSSVFICLNALVPVSAIFRGWLTGWVIMFLGTLIFR